MAYGGLTTCPDANAALAYPVYEAECRHWAETSDFGLPDGAHPPFVREYFPKASVHGGVCFYAISQVSTGTFSQPDGAASDTDETLAAGAVYWSNAPAKAADVCLLPDKVSLGIVRDR